MDPLIAKKIDQEFTKYPLRKYPKGQILLFAGDEPTQVFYIIEGKVRKYDISPKGDELVVSLPKPPVPIPLTAILNNTPSNYFYRTEEVVLLHCVPVKDALHFIKSNNDVLFGILCWSYQVIDGLQGRIIQLMSGNAKSRVIYELIYECQLFGHEKPDGRYQLNSSETGLAARAGLSRETVSREINKLKKAGLVSISGRYITVTDLNKLQEKLL